MRSRFSVLYATLAFLASGAGAHAQQTEPLVIQAQPGSRLWLEGTTNVHGFVCGATTVRAEFQLDNRASFAAPASGAAPLREARVTVPVRGLKCGNVRMEQDLYRAIRADSFPSITFVLRTATVTTVHGAVQKAQVDGFLSLVGMERPLSLPVEIVRRTDGSVVARGSTTILMTDHGVRPPTALLGIIRTGNEVRVSFDARVILPDSDVLAGARTFVLMLNGRASAPGRGATRAADN